MVADESQREVFHSILRVPNKKHEGGEDAVWVISSRVPDQTMSLFYFDVTT